MFLCMYLVMYVCIQIEKVFISLPVIHSQQCGLSLAETSERAVLRFREPNWYTINISALADWVSLN